MWIYDETSLIVQYELVQYIVMGSWEESSEIEIDGITITKSSHYPTTNIKEEHFVVDLDVDLDYQLTLLGKK